MLSKIIELVEIETATTKTLMRWWNVKTTTPSGIKINRAWHVRQFMYALFAPVAALLTMEAVKSWESGYSARHPLRKIGRPGLGIEDANEKKILPANSELFTNNVFVHGGAQRWKEQCLETAVHVLNNAAEAVTKITTFVMKAATTVNKEAKRDSSTNKKEEN